MYSRNQSHTFADDEYENEEYDDEYELYGYNLPPNYDGSRFQTKKRRNSFTKPRSMRDSRDTDPQRRESEEVREDTGHVHTNENGTAIGKLLDALGGRFGYEEMLIISIILILSYDTNCGDTVLFLALLLITD